MKHLGDITKLNGAEIPKVDIITGGSPCQDLSVAGKRAGLEGERSGLFMEQIRLIKEMRESDRADGRTDVNIRPRFMVWENVPGAFSSNKGEDFRCVLEETAKIADSNATIPRLATGKDGKQKWTKAGAIMGDGWSIAWRVHDAQFWGVPQRRKRISLVADFGGDTAPEILFERESLSRDTETSGEERQGITANSKGCLNPTSYTFKIRGEVDTDSSGKKAGKGPLVQTELSATLGVSQDQTLITKCLNPLDVQSKHIQPKDGIAEALYSGECRGGGGESYVLQQKVFGICSDGSNSMKSDNPHSGVYEASTTRTIDLNGGNPACNQGGMAVVYTTQASGDRNNPSQSYQKVNQPLSANMEHDATNGGLVMDNIQSIGHDLRSAKFTDDEITDPLTATDYKDPIKISYDSVVRRLTPLECERLQGYPDGWTDIGEWVDSKGKKRKDSDSPRYKALGNSIALPFWQWMAHKMVKYIDGHQPTMASLFDGIGGFPLVFSRAGAKPIWASEIEEFPIAVTKIRFPEEEEKDMKEASNK